MDTDKNTAIITVILSVSEKSYTPAVNHRNKQESSSSFRYNKNNRKYTIICVHLRSSADH